MAFARRLYLFFLITHVAYPAIRKKPSKPAPPAAQYIGDRVFDFLLINRNIFTQDTLKLLTATVPLYIGARAIDQDTHRYCYDPVTHTNLCPTPEWTHHTLEEVGGLVPTAFLSSFWLLASDPRLKMVSRTYVFGALSVFLAKNLIKNTWETDCTMRPPNGDFPKKRVYGGFPSGHTAIFTYNALYWGLQYGPKAAIPLGIYGATATWLLLVNNRHYVSQIVGGAVLGAAYAIAASKVANWRWSEHIKADVSVSASGRVTAGVSYKF